MPIDYKYHSKEISRVNDLIAKQQIQLTSLKSEATKLKQQLSYLPNSIFLTKFKLYRLQNNIKHLENKLTKLLNKMKIQTAIIDDYNQQYENENSLETITSLKELCHLDKKITNHETKRKVLLTQISQTSSEISQLSTENEQYQTYLNERTKIDNNIAKITRAINQTSKNLAKLTSHHKIKHETIPIIDFDTETTPLSSTVTTKTNSTFYSDAGLENLPNEVKKDDASFACTIS